MAQQRRTTGPDRAGRFDDVERRLFAVGQHLLLVVLDELAGRINVFVATGHAGSNLLRVVFPQMIDEDFAPRGFARQVLKDLEMLQAAARDRHLAMPMASQALTLYRLLVAAGKSELDATAVVTLYPKP